MAEVNAADLPEGTVIGYASLATIKVGSGDYLRLPWATTHDGMYDDDTVNDWLCDGAEVLRHGYGNQM